MCRLIILTPTFPSSPLGVSLSFLPHEKQNKAGALTQEVQEGRFWPENLSKADGAEQPGGRGSEQGDPGWGMGWPGGAGTQKGDSRANFPWEGRKKA